VADVQSGKRFATAQATLPWQPILGAKMGKSAKKPSFLGLAFHNGWQDGKPDGRVDTPDALSTQRKNLVNFGPLIPELTTLMLGAKWAKSKNRQISATV